MPSRVSGAIEAPSSKSYAQRAIAAALLAEGTTVLRNMELCSDTQAAVRVAQMLGATVENIASDEVLIHGGLSPVTSIIDIGESGLSARMFSPIAALSDRPITITGSGTILLRPMDMLIDPLRQLGVKVGSVDGRLPVTVCGPLLGRQATVDGSVSSQFVTGLLMALPLAANDTVFRLTDAKSTPYIDMTFDVLADFGIKAAHNDYSEFFVAGNQRYTPREYRVEGDWSGASCLLVAGAVAGEVTVRNLRPLSKQADVAVIEALSRAGAGVEIAERSVTVRKPEQLAAFRFDATHCPDLFPALVALAANCRGVSEIAGVSRLAHKESDRSVTLREEYGKMGVEVDVVGDVMTVCGGRIGAAQLDSHADHRIAMSVAVAALNADGPSKIAGAECVAKSYPDFWDDLACIMAG